MASRTADPEKIKAVVRRIRPVDEITPHAKVLVYGDNGSGKTRFAASAPKCLIVDVTEEGTRSAAGSGSHYLTADTFDDIGQIYWYLRSGKHKFESVAIDTITAMENVALAMVLDEAENRDPTRERRMPDQRSWGRANELVKGMLMAYRNLPMHVIFTAQARDVIDRETEELTARTVDLPAGSRGVAMGMVGILGYLEPREVTVKRGSERKREWRDTLYVGPHETFSTKDRTNNLGKLVLNPTMDKIIQAWNSNSKETE
jgi:AAA domain